MILTEREFSETLSILTEFEEHCRIVCAFSGGCDSLALLILLTKTLGKDNVVPVYVNHNLRSLQELEKEVEKNKLNCEQLGLQLIVETIDRGIIEESAKIYGGIEAAARFFRYQALEKQRVKNRCSYIATAHHFDDQLETVLMKIIGNGSDTSMRGITEKKGTIIRPLLEFRRKDIKNYVRSLGFSWSTDSTNSDNGFKRNELRNIIIPQLNKEMPDWEIRVENIRKQAVALCSGKYEFTDKVSVSYLKELNIQQQTMVLFSMWDATVKSQMPKTLVKRVLSSLDKSYALTGANGGTFCLHKGVLYLVNDELNRSFEEFITPLNVGGITYLPDGNYIEASDGGNDKNLRIDPILFEGQPYVRYVKEGDTVKLKDGSKTVLRLLQDLKVPPVLRKRVPVIADSKEICAVFASEFGSGDRICLKLRSALAHNHLYSYIYKKGK